MNARVAAKGWCPGAWRPMASGDGLIVRVRPVLGRLTAAQVATLCDAAMECGSGMLELTSRANLQLRGVRGEAHEDLLARLWELGLIDADQEAETRRNLLVAPLWQAGDDTESTATALLERLADLPVLPAKFGFAIDAGEAPVLGAASADIRLERGVTGGMILRADGCAKGRPVTAGDAVDEIIRLARWFAETSGTAGRMARHPALREVEGSEPPAPSASLPVPGDTLLGSAWGVAFGQIDADRLARLVTDSGAEALRITPSRVVILEGGKAVGTEGFIGDRSNPLLTTDACPGAPLCGSATVETRKLARALAGHVAGLHVSGCAKGCARARAAPVTLVGRDGRFDLVSDGAAWDAPQRRGMTPAQVLELFGVAR
ncbi:MAG: cobalamin biosynthesis protein CobG [Cereibacter sphaeroides]|uniref:Cobalamin biosynthesis protein CobG n=1 Tax=Cereibacter sphaeroides TaxID=1063 RepID=A0A2W5S8N6_CERSP|nr:MAG: cobalamin biosynthesis protein CobG [Cereibacter sphaeroides]